jgi:hypothetical protein
MIKSRKIRWAGHVGQMGGDMHTGNWWKNQNGRDHLEGQEVGGWIILKWILEEYDGMVWTELIWLKIGTGSCEHDNEPSGSINYWDILEWLHNWQLLKKGSAP